MTEQEQLHAQEEPLSLPRQVVDMIMSTLQNGTAKEVAECNMADRLDISEVLPNIDTTNWCEEAQDYLKEIYRIVKGTSLDTRHDLKLSFPPSDFSKTDDPVSLTYEGCYKAVGYTIPPSSMPLRNSKQHSLKQWHNTALMQTTVMSFSNVNGIYGRICSPYRRLQN